MRPFDFLACFQELIQFLQTKHVLNFLVNDEVTTTSCHYL